MQNAELLYIVFANYLCGAFQEKAGNQAALLLRGDFQAAAWIDWRQLFARELTGCLQHRCQRTTAGSAG